MPKVYLLSRGLDPILGVFTGLLAYHLSETNPRTRVPPGHTLRELVGWRWGIWQTERHARDAAIQAALPADQREEANWEQVRRELEGDGKAGKA